MFNLILIRRRQMRAHGAMVAGDHHATSPRRLLLIDPVLDVNALLLASLTQSVGVLVFAYAADVPDGVGGQHVRGATCSVLGTAASDEFCIAVLEQVVIEGHVLGFGEDGVVDFEVVLLEQVIVAGARCISSGTAM